MKIRSLILITVWHITYYYLSVCHFLPYMYFKLPQPLRGIYTGPPFITPQATRILTADEYAYILHNNYSLELSTLSADAEDLRYIQFLIKSGMDNIEELNWRADDVRQRFGCAERNLQILTKNIELLYKSLKIDYMAQCK